MMDLAQFIAKHNITMELCTRADDNPNMNAANKARMHHYRITLMRINSDGEKERLVSPFSMGSALTHEPTIEELLYCLKSEVQSLEDARSYVEWANEVGLSLQEPSEQRSAQHAYKVIKKEQESLKQFLGEQAYDEFIHKVDA